MESLNHKKWRNQPNAYRGEYSSQYEISKMTDFVGQGYRAVAFEGALPKGAGVLGTIPFFLGFGIAKGPYINKSHYLGVVHSTAYPTPWAIMEKMFCR